MRLQAAASGTAAANLGLDLHVRLLGFGMELD
jgi:hypothetical protein